MSEDKPRCGICRGVAPASSHDISAAQISSQIISKIKSESNSPNPSNPIPTPIPKIEKIEIESGKCLRCKKKEAETNQGTLCHQCFLEADYSEIKSYLAQKGVI